MSQARRLRLAFLLLSLPLLSCLDGPFTAPANDMKPTTSSEASLQAPTLTGGLSPSASNAPVGPNSLGSYTYPTLAEVKVTGMLTRSYSNYPAIWGAYAGATVGPFDASGEFIWSMYDCFGYVSVSFSSSGWVGFCDYGNYTPATSTWSTMATVQGNGIVAWTQPYTGSSVCDGVGQPPCFEFTGSFDVSVTPVAANFVLRPSRHVVVQGDSVTFWARRSPSNVPFQIQGWTWTPDGGTATSVSCDTVCVTTPNTSGTMQVSAIVNGVPSTKSVHIRVLCAPTGDPLLDSLPILDAMKDAWDQSGADDPDGNQRRERPFTVNCNADGECEHEVGSSPYNAPCSSQMPPQTPGEVARGHTHPFIPYGSPGQEDLPDPTCPQKQGPYDANRYAFPGPSGADYNHAAGPGSGVPNYVVDGSRIYGLPPGTNPAQIAAGMTKTPRNSQGCNLY
jgi:hypothetical protein